MQEGSACLHTEPVIAWQVCCISTAEMIQMFGKCPCEACSSAPDLTPGTGSQWPVPACFSLGGRNMCPADCLSLQFEDPIRGALKTAISHMNHAWLPVQAEDPVRGERLR